MIGMYKKLIEQNSSGRNIVIAHLALSAIAEKGVAENLENEINWTIIDDCIANLQALIDFEPDESVSSQQFERDGGYGLSSAERNK